MLLVIAVTLIAVLVVTAVYAIRSTRDASDAAAAYQSQRQQTQQAIQRAKAAGFTDQDLTPITTQFNRIGPAGGSFWPGTQTASYRKQAAALVALRTRLAQYLQQVVAQAKSDVTRHATTAGTLLQQNAQQGGSEAPMQQRLQGIGQRVGATTSIREVRELDGEVQRLNSEAATEGATLKQENAAIQQAAAGLLAHTQDVNALRAQGIATLTASRNDATVAAYEAKAKRFKPIDTLMAASDRMEFYNSKLNAPDAQEVAFATAAVQRYGGQVHQLLATNLARKQVIVYWQAQQMFAFENGQQVQSTAVTTGPRGDTAFGTDFGPMKVLRKNHPYKMHSPWPQGSPYWYPDTTVQYAVFFTGSGEAFHDASWQQDSTLGPGSQYTEGTRSHGCIHLPWQGPNLAEWMYNWADLNMPVDVIPGNGAPVSDQLGLMTTNDNGQPLTPA
ncbi:MAG: L,D-transpeptidase [Candidatus Dormibacteraeota bacterium]|nr:L,D-transpeptidase [Candidatus Dormibacteraeota bacterium]